MNFDLPKTDKLYSFILILIFYSLFSTITFNFNSSIIKKINSFQISLFLVVFFFLFLEIFYKIKPNIFPLQLRNWIKVENKNKSIENITEYINVSPFVKFRPNTVVRNIFWRGNDNQFIYEWKTDKLGFKNLDYISNLNIADVVALGNSFTEGMGVSTENTWPSLLSAKGYSTYNLGVQGYAPTQMLGVFKKYGKQLKPKYIIIGYLKGTYAREKIFFNIEQAVKDKNFGAGIGQIAEQNLNTEIRNQVKFVSSAIWISTKGIQKNFSNTINLLNSNLVDTNLKSYEKEISFFHNLADLDPSPLRSWKNTLKKFLDIKNAADSIGAKTAILYFPSRPLVYYERAMGNTLKAYNGKAELNLLQDFTKKHDILFINPSNRLINYVNNLNNNFDIKLLPYLEIDGHMSKIGYQLVVDEIISSINKN